MRKKRIHKKRPSFYLSWARMKQRCLNPNNPAYNDYGGRGITVCDDWMEFKNFNKDMLETYEKGLTLDRINNEGNYNKKNCRWATMKVQNNNTRKNRNIFYDGVTKTLAQWAEYLGIKRSTLAQRYYVYKWNINKCFTY